MIFNHDILSIAEKIDNGIKDVTTISDKYIPLWNNPFVRESLITAIKENDETYKENFKIICSILEPNFLSEYK